MRNEPLPLKHDVNHGKHKQQNVKTTTHLDYTKATHYNTMIIATVQKCISHDQILIHEELYKVFVWRSFWLDPKTFKEAMHV